MKEENGIIMSGEKMELLMGSGCIQSCDPELAVKLPSISERLSRTLQHKDVARYFIRDIRIGETVALVDRQCGYTFRLRVEAHAVHVVGIYRKPPKNTVQQMVVLFGDRMFGAVCGKAAA